MRRGAEGTSVPVTLLGHKGDLMLIHLRRGFEELQAAELAVAGLGLAAFLEPTTSFVSMVELAMYEMTMQIHKRLGERGLEARQRRVRGGLRRRARGAAEARGRRGSSSTRRRAGTSASTR